MDLGECVAVGVVVSALLLGPALACAGDAAQGDFSVWWEPHLVGGREAAVKVPGGYFIVRVAVTGATYRVTVESYDAISTVAAGRGPAGAPAASPLMSL